MNNLEKIKNVLNFYVISNNLKNIILDEENNYSIADNIFGSMILATAINSELKETKNLAKIYRMLFLYEYINLDENNEILNLNLKKQYIKEIMEARDLKTKNGRLIFKYKMLDFLLTNTIKEKEENQTELIKEGSTIIATLCDSKPQKCEEIFKFYYLNTRLKDKVRTGWDKNHWNVSSDRVETVSEHVVGTFGLALALSSEFGYKFDVDKMMKMIPIHETGETIIGDITPFDGITPEQKKKLEHLAMQDALGKLEKRKKLLSLLYEFDDQKTPEAKCAHYCDKIEADLQSKIYQEKGLHHSLDDQENNCVFKSSKVQKMLENGAKDVFDIWYEWDKKIYENDLEFPEFMNILKIARLHELLHLDDLELSDESKLAKLIKIK